MSIEIVGGTEAVVTRDMAAAPERVWRAFTDPDDAAQWMWGAGAADVTAELDPRVGGRYRVARGGEGFRGLYVEVDEPRRLTFTLRWEAPVGYEPHTDEAAIVTFEATDTGTRVTYRHVGIPDDGVAAVEHGKAIQATLDALAALVEG